MAMNLERKIHPIQARILRTLLFRPEARFSQLNTTKMSTDHFTFHLKRLVEVGLVEKTRKNSYRLTSGGKEFANRFDTEEVVLEKQAKIGVLVGGVRKKNGQRQYLTQQRFKQPYFGFCGFLTGKVKWGETIFEAAARELEEETGLSGNLTLVGIQHKTDFSQKDQLLEDKYFFVIRADCLKGKLKKEFEGGKNQWLTRVQILKLPDVFPNMELTIKMLDQDKLIFRENKYLVSRY